MNQITVEIVTKTETQNSFGRVTGETYVVERLISCSYILPSGDASTLQKYGIETKTTHKLLTREHLQSKQTIRFSGDVYLVKYVAEFPTHNEIVLEKVVK